ncbi:MAG: response regulator [Chitinivibrionales bacterium]|nr:response regulator [Chitinivibrionales bacterium]
MDKKLPISTRKMIFRLIHLVVIASVPLVIAVYLYDHAEKNDARRFVVTSAKNSLIHSNLTITQYLLQAQSYVQSMASQAASAQMSLAYGQLTDYATLIKNAGCGDIYRGESIRPFDSTLITLKILGNVFCGDTIVGDKRALRHALKNGFNLFAAMQSAHATYPFLQWSYFYDAKHLFSTVYPYFSQEYLLQTTGTKNVTEALKVIYDAGGTSPLTLVGPVNNKRKKCIWTTPYIDAGGKGLMVSVLSPLYIKGEYTGVIGTDITLSSLHELLASSPSDGNLWILDKEHHVLARTGAHRADSALSLAKASTLFPQPLNTLFFTADTLPDHLTVAGLHCLSIPMYIDGWHICMTFEEENLLFQEKNVSNEWLVIVVIFSVFILTIFFIGRQYVIPALHLSTFLQRQLQDYCTPIPRVPHQWLHVFERVAGLVSDRAGGFTRSYIQQKAIASIATLKEVASGTIDVVAEKITELGAESMGVERVGVWLLGEVPHTLTCIDMYDKNLNKHSKGIHVPHSGFAQDFEAFKSQRFFDSTNSIHDHMIGRYLNDPLLCSRVTAVLDAAIRVGESDFGIVCFEHVQTLHQWEQDEIAFACQMADQIALTIINRDRLKTQATLRDSEERFRGLFENSRDAICVISYPELMFVDANQAAINLFKVKDRETFLKRGPISCSPSLQPDAQPSERYRTLHVEQALACGVATFEWNHRRADGALFPSQVILNKFVFRETVFLQASIRDLSQQKRLEEHLRQSQRLESIGQLAGGVAHDFNNLLTGISGYVELVKETLEASHPCRDMINEIGTISERASNLTHQLLAFSRQQVIEPRVVMLNTIIEELHKMLSRVIGEDIRLTKTLQKELYPVKVDRGQIEQVLVNLVVNARDAMPDGGVLEIATASIVLDEGYCTKHSTAINPGVYCMLAVSDTGCGIPKELLNRIFEPFFTTKPVGKGTGLGLAMVWGAVKQNDGFMDVYSEVNKGTTFKIYFPALLEAIPDFAAEKAFLSREEVSDITILLVEDDPIVRQIAYRLLCKHGYSVIVCPSPEEAIEQARTYPKTIHLLLTDVIMPGMSGNLMAEQIMLIRPGIAVLYGSGYTENIIAHHGVLDEGVNFICKPYTAHLLIKKIDQILKNSRLKALA